MAREMNLENVANSEASQNETPLIIEQLKSRFRVATDQGLAEALKVGRSTIANWRRRDSVPKRYAALATTDTKERLTAAFDYSRLSPDERAALCLAIMRMHKGYLTRFDEYPEFLKNGGFIPLQVGGHMEQALLDILAEMERGGFDNPEQCLYSIVYNEFFGG